MARVDIPLPAQFDFSSDTPLLVSHINSGNHLGNDSVITLLNEARMRFLSARGVSEAEPVPGLTIVNADLAVRYLSEAFYGESIRMAVSATDFHRCGFDLVYRLSEPESERVVALAKTAHLLIDPRAKRAVDLPASVREALQGR